MMTIETRLRLNDHQESLLDSCVQTWAQAYRQTWSYFNRQQLSEKEIYQKLSQMTNFTSHQIGSLINKVKAEHKKIKAMTQTQLNQIHAKIDQIQKFILKKNDEVTKSKAKGFTKEYPPLKRAKDLFLIHQKTKKLYE